MNSKKLKSDKRDFRPKLLRGDNEGQFLLIKRKIHQKKQFLIHKHQTSVKKLHLKNTTEFMSSANRGTLTISLPICIPFISSSCLIALEYVE
jgi:hypothetical protein